MNINMLTDSQIADTKEFKELFQAYLETALWETIDYIDGVEMPINDHFSTDDFSVEALSDSESECIDFYRLAVAATEAHNEDNEDFKLNLKQIGQDFWLTRGRHGAGFWDGDYPDSLGVTLTDIAHFYGNVDLYPASDKVYIF